MRVEFTVTKRVSLSLLGQEPETRPGDAVAVVGRLAGVDPDTDLITLRPVIVRHKDRLTPKVGKELLCEVDPTATYYSYTGGKKAVSLTYRDRDLLKFKGEILGKKGKQAWADFLEKEVAERNKARAVERAAKKAAQAARKQQQDSTE
jgi:hypothetical protein